MASATTSSLLLLAIAVITHGLVQERLGCYKMRNKGKRFSLCGFQNTYHSLTVRQCNTLCFTKGFTHAATKNGHECHCGDVEDDLPPAANETECNVNCAGDPGDMCGGRRAFSLYSTGIVEEPVDDLEVGCLTDGGDLRLIKEHKIDLQLTNSPARCVAYCRALGYRHAGVQYTFECYCGEAERLEPLANGCDLACVTDEEIQCGGNWKMNVYYTGVTDPGPEVKLLGCFNPSKGGGKSLSISTLTPYKCVAECLWQRYPYASLFNGTECICSERKERKKVDLSNCNVPCIGEPGVSCGGEKHVESYSTGLAGDVILGKLIGCFIDESGDLLKGSNLVLLEQNSAGYCITRCLAQGFAFAGVRNTQECVCSQDAPKRVPVTIRPDVQCEYPCLSVQTESCGSNTNTLVLLYRTGLDTARTNCIKSTTKVGGENACIGQQIFEDHFDTLNLTKWLPTQQISGEDNEFVTYTKNSVSVENGTLIIQPRIMDDDFIRYGNISLTQCTGTNRACNQIARGHQILPPVWSGQVCSRQSFSFRYGRITITARMPEGDWVYPQLWLKPAHNIYGPEYLSGKVVLALARGNSQLKSASGSDFSNTQLFTTLMVSKNMRNIMALSSKRNSKEPWHKQFHNFTFIWSEDTLASSVNSNLDLKTLYSNKKSKSLVHQMGLYANDIWPTSNRLAPFDQEFYICLGVGVGGGTVFPDSAASSTSSKPWANYKVKGMLNFYKNMDSWKKTWNDRTKLEVDSVVVQAV